MRSALLMLSLYTAFSCNKENKLPNTPEQNSTATIAQKNREIDSLKKIIAERDLQGPSDESSGSTHSEAEHASADESFETPDLSGKHSLTLQWISWEKPGTIHFTKTGENTYKVIGRQEINKQYVSVKGTVTQLSHDELEFDGTIITKTNFDGRCEKNGKQIFLSTKNRKYWRLQNMQNCNGAVDYVDIYF